ncbi:unnamed protein product [Closterium sp. Naga37s-1]|nr:unnamed protein product [Closterium sp. Naga37s-1]
MSNPSFPLPSPPIHALPIPPPLSSPLNACPLLSKFPHTPSISPPPSLLQPPPSLNSPPSPPQVSLPPLLPLFPLPLPPSSPFPYPPLPPSPTPLFPLPLPPFSSSLTSEWLSCVECPLRSHFPTSSPVIPAPSPSRSANCPLPSPLSSRPPSPSRPLLLSHLRVALVCRLSHLHAASIPLITCSPRSANYPPAFPSPPPLPLLLSHLRVALVCRLSHLHGAAIPPITCCHLAAAPCPHQRAPHHSLAFRFSAPARSPPFLFALPSLSPLPRLCARLSLRRLVPPSARAFTQRKLRLRRFNLVSSRVACSWLFRWTVMGLKCVGTAMGQRWDSDGTAMGQKTSMLRPSESGWQAAGMDGVEPPDFEWSRLLPIPTPESGWQAGGMDRVECDQLVRFTLTEPVPFHPPPLPHRPTLSPPVPVVLASGADFYASPRLSPDGRQLAWMEWSHPHMPWERSRVMVGTFDDDGYVEAWRLSNVCGMAWGTAAGMGGVEPPAHAVGEEPRDAGMDGVEPPAHAVGKESGDGRGHSTMMGMWHGLSGDHLHMLCERSRVMVGLGHVMTGIVMVPPFLTLHSQRISLSISLYLRPSLPIPLHLSIPSSLLASVHLHLSVLTSVQSAAGTDAAIIEAPMEPLWSPQGELYFLSDRHSGFWDLHRWNPSSGTAEAVADMPKHDGAGLLVEVGGPLWVFGNASYAFIPGTSHHVAVICQVKGQSQLGMIDTHTRAFTLTPPSHPPLSQMSHLLKPSPDMTSLQVIYPPIRVSTTIHTAGTFQGPQGALPPLLVKCHGGPTGCLDSALRLPLQFWTSRGFAVVDVNYGGSTGVLPPPLLVKCHGGPTGCLDSALRLPLQLWTSRGFAVVDVNYGGSTGYGREYRERLRGQWGVVDVDDACCCVDYLVRAGLVGGSRVAIDGSSAGGFKPFDTPQLLPVRAGLVDGSRRVAIDGSSADGLFTHFTLPPAFSPPLLPHFLPRCVHSWWTALRWPLTGHQHANSPIPFELISPDALLLYILSPGACRAGGRQQGGHRRVCAGLVDGTKMAIDGSSAGGFTTLSALTFRSTFKAGCSLYGVVSPEQARAMHAAVKAKGLPVAIVEFPDEDHGFRNADNIKAALEMEHEFFCRVLLNLPLPSDKKRLTIDNVDEDA